MMPATPETIATVVDRFMTRYEIEPEHRPALLQVATAAAIAEPDPAAQLTAAHCACGLHILEARIPHIGVAQRLAHLSRENRLAA